MPSKASQYSWKTLISFDTQFFHEIQQSNRDLSAKVMLEEFSLSSSAHCDL